MTASKILIVDDDEDFSMALAIRLRAHGYKVVSAADSVTALSTARQEKPDLVLLDLGLPAGDGFTALERMKILAPLASIPVIVVSARDPRANKHRAREAGAVAYFQKPVENLLLLAAIRKALGETSAESLSE